MLNAPMVMANTSHPLSQNIKKDGKAASNKIS
jgi:hypothetical protein